MRSKKLRFLSLFLAIACESFSAAQAQDKASIALEKSELEKTTQKNSTELKSDESPSPFKNRWLEYRTIRDKDGLDKAVEYAISKHVELKAQGYNWIVPFPLSFAGWDCIRHKDYKTARQVYAVMLDSASDDQWVYPQDCLWNLYITEGQPKQAATEIKAFLIGGKLPAKPLPKRAFYSMLKKTYERLNDKEGQQTMEKLLTDKHCPVCGSVKSIEEYIYGYAGNKGCIVTDWSPMFKCKTDNVEF